MSSISAASPAPSNALTGSRVTFMIQGVVAGFAQNISHSSGYNLQGLNVIGSIETIQHIPTAYSCSINFNNFVILGRTLRTLGLWPKIGKNPQEHLLNLSSIPELTAVATDSITQTILLVAEGVRIETAAIQAAAQSMLSEDVSAVCRRIYFQGDDI